MIAQLKPYPSTKDSGVAWLGKVPSHWPTGRLKSWMENVVEQDSKRRGSDAYIALEHIESWTGRVRVADSNLSLDSQLKRFRSGDVLFGKLRPYLAKVAFPKHGGLCVGEFLVLRTLAADVMAPYMELLLRSKPIINAINSSTFGARMPRADWRFIGGMAVAMPPVAEQAAIARFLDRADRRIQHYIRAKEKLIALLEEQKQTIIHQAATGQINVRNGQPYPAYKPSCVEWLGMVPEHWDVAALRHRYDQRLGKMLDTKRITGKYLVPYLRNVDVQWDHINLSNLPLMDILPQEFERYTVQPGDLLVCEGGEVGRCAIWNGEMKLCAYQKALHQLRPICADQDKPRFLLYVLRLAAAKDAFNDGQESTIGHLTGEKLRCHRFVFPPVTEQRGIVRYLDAACSRIDGAFFRAQREIELVREYRTRLIADVVTGKLDVREAAVALPDVDPLADDDKVDDSPDKGGVPPFDHEDQPAGIAG